MISLLTPRASLPPRGSVPWSSPTSNLPGGKWLRGLSSRPLRLQVAPQYSTHLHIQNPASTQLELPGMERASQLPCESLCSLGRKPACGSRRAFAIRWRPLTHPRLRTALTMNQGLDCIGFRREGDVHWARAWGRQDRVGDQSLRLGIQGPEMLLPNRITVGEDVFLLFRGSDGLKR